MSGEEQIPSKQDIVENLQALLEYARRRHEGIVNMLARYDEKLKKFLTVDAFLYAALAFAFKMLRSPGTNTSAV